MCPKASNEQLLLLWCCKCPSATMTSQQVGHFYKDNVRGKTIIMNYTAEGRHQFKLNITGIIYFETQRKSSGLRVDSTKIKTSNQTFQ